MKTPLGWVDILADTDCLILRAIGEEEWQWTCDVYNCETDELCPIAQGWAAAAAGAITFPPGVAFAIDEPFTLRVPFAMTAMDVETYAHLLAAIYFQFRYRRPCPRSS